MTVRVERTFEIAAPPERVWEFIADPGKRARPISVVDSFEVHDDTRATWHLSLPLPLVNRTITVETEDTERDPPSHVEFVGRSRVMRVVGEHDLEAVGEGTRLTNRFTVEGKLPGVERFFERNLDGELDNLEAAIRRESEIEV
ncbi:MULTISPECIES: CoxG family protein [Halococcus]|uniref:CoxG family protein n=1 Tax=Halococcus TaxID=2249 RepID=UPI000E732D0A|nr:MULTISPECIES: SRPBCC family protein [Halococcus]RJS98156.1 polyketide cyclase [Halococcus sp. IIIV-5B]